MAATSPIGTLTIASGQTASAELSLAAAGTRRPMMLGITAPAALTGTVNLQVATSPGGTFVVFQSPPGTDVAIGPSKGVSLIATPFGAIKLVSTLAEGSDRVFNYVALTTE